MSKTRLPLSEMQGLLASGYMKQRAMCGLLLKIVDVALARTCLNEIHSQISFCDNKASDSKLNVAVTYRAMEQLLDAELLHGLPREFREGMVTVHRQRILGDLTGSPSDPQQWQWGGPNRQPVDILLLAYSLNSTALEEQLNALRAKLSGLEIIKELRSTALVDDKEHFGFRDGFSQPWVEDLHRPGFDRDRIEAGELVLGYADNTGTPEPFSAFSVNGSFLVLRQIVQRVPEFWQALPSNSDEQKVRQAAKLVGRWPDGTPLVLSPDPPATKPPATSGSETTHSFNDFDYARLDPDGLRCPLGSHIRRSNPRDGILSNPTESLQFTNRHRILRRGRTFGLPAPAEVFPAGVIVQAEPDAVGDAESRGLLFLCLNASLARQFEFIQQTWINNPKQMNLSSETDAIASPVLWSGPGQRPTHTEPALPLRRRTIATDTYVQTIGGEYFLLPGRAALKKLAEG